MCIRPPRRCIVDEDLGSQSALRAHTSTWYTSIYRTLSVDVRFPHYFRKGFEEKSCTLHLPKSSSKAFTLRLLARLRGLRTTHTARHHTSAHTPSGQQALAECPGRGGGTTGVARRAASEERQPLHRFDILGRVWVFLYIGLQVPSVSRLVSAFTNSGLDWLLLCVTFGSSIQSRATFTIAISV